MDSIPKEGRKMRASITIPVTEPATLTDHRGTEFTVDAVVVDAYDFGVYPTACGATPSGERTNTRLDQDELRSWFPELLPDSWHQLAAFIGAQS